MKKALKRLLSTMMLAAMVVTSGPFTAYAYGEDESSQTESAALYAETAEDDTVSENMLQSDAEAVTQVSEKDLGWTEDIQQGKWTIDADTKGNWTGKYGGDGYVLCAWDNTNDVDHFPYYIDSVEYLTEDRSGGYVARTGESQEGNDWWDVGIPNGSDPDGTRKIAYRFDDKQQTVRINVNDTDEHILTFYSVSENNNGRQQTVQLYKAGTTEKVGEPVTVDGINEGKYITTTFSGSVDAVFTNDNYNPLVTNTVVNGIFFDTNYEEGQIPVRRVSVAPADGETIRTETGEIQMTAAVYPENATDQTMTWSITEGEDVASVDADGKVTILKEGSFTVRAVSHDPEVWNEVTMACIPAGDAPETTEWELIGEDYVLFQNSFVRIIFDLTTGRYNVYEQSSGNPYVLGAYYQVNDQKSTAGRSFTVEELEKDGEGRALRLTGSREGSYDILLDISLEDDSGDILLSAGINNTSDEGVKVMQMYPMAAKYQEKGGIFVGPDPAVNHAVLTGEGNWTVPQVKQTVDTTSKNNLMISYREEPNMDSFLIGQLTTYSFQSTITTDYNPDASLDNNGRRSIDGDIRIYDNTGKLVDSQDLYVGDTALLNFTEKNPYDSLEKYADRQAEAMDVQLMDFDPYIYECLWYVNWYTANANNADFAVQEVKDLYEKGLANYARPNLRVEPDTYVNPNEQLWWDDEHWKAFGHLTDTYPTMKSWIEAMHEAGGEGGTYMQASYRSDDYCEQYPGHMLYNDPQEGPDYTDPDFIQHMAEVYANLKDAGIRSIFYDYAGQYHGKNFGYLLDQTGGFEDEHATAVEAYRNIFALPKKYIGRDVRITENSWEYSGADVAIGLIDLQRNIHDTNEFSPAIAQASLNQWYRNRTTKLLYPDVKVFENEDLDLRHAQITGTAFLFGKMTLGESVNRMSDDKIKDVGKAVPFPIDGVSARPVGLFETDYVEKGLTNPEVLDYKFNSEYDDHILLFWNETTEAKTISADLGKNTAFGGVGLDPEKEYDIWDFWDWNYLGRVKGSEVLSLPVRKNEMKTMAVREVRDTPYLLSTNRHLLQGTEEIEAKDIQWNAQDNTFTGTFEIVANDTFKAIVPVSEGLVFKSFDFDNENVEGSAHFNTAGRYVEVTLDAEENQSVPFVMHFEEGETPADTTAPTEITGLRALADDYGIVTLTWDEAADESGSVYYEVYGSADADFTPGVENRLAITTKPEYTAGDAPEGDYYYMVAAKDAAGNTGRPASVRTNAVALAIPVGDLEASSGSSQSGQEASMVLDGKDNTLWHTAWNGTVPREDMWIDLHITNGPVSVGSLKYLPRSDQSTTSGLVKNGIIVKYRVDISRDHGQTYETLIEEGTFESISGWQTITFDTPVEVTNVRLYCLESADPGQQWASAAEMRLYNAAEFEGISMREESISLKVGETKTLLVDFFPTNFRKPVTFTSGSPDVASVDENGVVTAAAEGNAVITAEAEGKTAQCTVRVSGEPETEISTSVLEYALKLAEDVSTDGVVTSVVERFDSALANAQDILAKVQAGDTSVTQEMVDDAWQELITVMQYLSFKQGDKTDLEKVIALADEMNADLSVYLEEGKAEFTAALEAAKEVLADGDAMQDDVDASWKDLLTAMAGLQRIPDKSALQELLSKAESLKESDYEASGFALFRTAYTEAKAVYADPQATAEEVKTAEKNLENAIAELTASADTGNSSGKDNPADTDTGASSSDNKLKEENTAEGKIAGVTENTVKPAEKAVRTGDSANVSVMAGAAALAAAAAVIAWKKKRER